MSVPALTTVGGQLLHPEVVVTDQFGNPVDAGPSWTTVGGQPLYPEVVVTDQFGNPVDTGPSWTTVGGETFVSSNDAVFVESILSMMEQADPYEAALLLDILATHEGATQVWLSDGH